MKTEYNGNSGFRRFLNKYPVSIIFSLFFEFFINTRYVSLGIDLINKHKECIEEVCKNSACVYQYVKMNKDYKNFEYDEKFLREALKKDNFITSVKNLFFEDVKRDYAEIGGIITLENDFKINLYAIDDVFSPIVSKLDNYKKDYKGFINFYETHKEIFDEIERLEEVEQEFKTGVGERVIKKLKNNSIDNKVKIKLLNSLINIYKLERDNSHFLPDLRKYLSENLVFGEYVGNFHFHTTWMEPPSDNDLEISKEMREFVFVLNEKGFNIYVLEDSATVDVVEYREEKWSSFLKVLQNQFGKKQYRGGYLF